MDRPLTGFFTGEIRERGHRTGFKIVTMDGKEGVLAHEKVASRIRVGKYGVNLTDLDTIAVPAMVPSHADELLVIDEIGKMECYSSLFRETLLAALDAPNRLLATIALKGDRFIEQIKHRGDVELITVSDRNRDRLVEVLVRKLMKE